MTDNIERAVREAFPAIDRIDDDDLRRGVGEAWTLAFEEAGWTPDTAPWDPAAAATLGLDGERLVDHVNDVVACAAALAETLTERRDLDLSTDLVLAGALVHDVGKVYEFAPPEGSPTPVADLLGHPYYGIVPAARAGLPPEVLHVVLAHTGLTTVDPATIEATVVARADDAAGAALRAPAVEDLRDADA